MIRLINFIENPHQHEDVSSYCQDPSEMSTPDLLKFRHMPDSFKLQEELVFKECSSTHEVNRSMEVIGITTTKALNVFLILLRLNFYSSVDEELRRRAALTGSTLDSYILFYELRKSYFKNSDRACNSSVPGCSHVNQSNCDPGSTSSVPNNSESVPGVTAPLNQNNQNWQSPLLFSGGNSTPLDSLTRLDSCSMDLQTQQASNIEQPNNEFQTFESFMAEMNCFSRNTVESDRLKSELRELLRSLRPRASERSFKILISRFLNDLRQWRDYVAANKSMAGTWLDKIQARLCRGTRGGKRAKKGRPSKYVGVSKSRRRKLRRDKAKGSSSV